MTSVITKDDGSFPIATDKQDRLLKVASIGYTIQTSIPGCQYSRRW